MQTFVHNMWLSCAFCFGKRALQEKYRCSLQHWVAIAIKTDKVRYIYIYIFIFLYASNIRHSQGAQKSRRKKHIEPIETQRLWFDVTIFLRASECFTQTDCLTDRLTN